MFFGFLKGERSKEPLLKTKAISLSIATVIWLSVKQTFTDSPLRCKASLLNPCNRVLFHSSFLLWDLLTVKAKLLLKKETHF